MKNSTIGLVAFLFLLSYTYIIAQEQEIAIVTCSWNNIAWCKKNLDSTTRQDYSNYKVYYVDDCSDDGTAEFVQKYITDHNLQEKVIYIRNEKQVRQMCGLYRIVHSLPDHVIVAVVDGDDWLAHDLVLKNLNEVYLDQNVWLTYGQYRTHPLDEVGVCEKIPNRIIRTGLYRKFPWITTHLRTFRAGLFKKIKKSDLMHNGYFFHAATDLAAMFPMLEMSGGKFKFIEDVLYIYNRENPFGTKNLHKGLQTRMAQIICSRKPYDRLEKQPW